MKLSIDFWEVISLMLSFVGLMFAAGKLLLAQIEKDLMSVLNLWKTRAGNQKQTGRNWKENFSNFVPSFRCIMSAEKIIFVAVQY